MRDYQGQQELFSFEEIEVLQEVVRDNYKAEFEKKSVIFVEDDESDFSQIDEPEGKRRLAQKNIFDVEALEEINSDLQKKKLEKAVVESHKELELPYFIEPKDDNERLFNLQYEYLTTHSQEAWGKLILFSSEVLKRILWNWMRTHRGEYLDEISQDEKVSIALEYVLRRYKKNVGWCVKNNFILTLKDGIRHAMKYSTKISRNTYLQEDL